MTGPARPPWHPVLVFGVLLAGIDLLSFNSQATASPEQVPWECSNYSDEAQTRCLNAFIERQQEQIGKLESQLQTQQNMVGELKGQVERQAQATTQLQQLAQPPVTTAIVPPPYVYPYAFAYPPAGIGLYFGRPWIGPGYYGYYARPWGPRFYYYGHHGRRR